MLKNLKTFGKNFNVFFFFSILIGIPFSLLQLQLEELREENNFLKNSG